MAAMSEDWVNRAAWAPSFGKDRERLASGRLTSDMARVSDDADLDKLVTRIHADLRAGRGSSRRPVKRWSARLKSLFRFRRPGPAVGGGRLRDTPRWLAPVLIFAVVTLLVVLFGAH